MVRESYIMALNARQRRAYTDTVDLWKPADVGADGNKNATDLTYVIAYRGVQCHYSSTPETEDVMIAGRTKTVNIFTLDEFHFVDTQEIEDTWAIKMTTPGHPETGRWWIVDGNPKTNSWRAHKRMVKAKNSPKPPTGAS